MLLLSRREGTKNGAIMEMNRKDSAPSFQKLGTCQQPNSGKQKDRISRGKPPGDEDLVEATNSLAHSVQSKVWGMDL